MKFVDNLLKDKRKDLRQELINIKKQQTKITEAFHGKQSDAQEQFLRQKENEINEKIYQSFNHDHC